jgi:hypothetical protein
VTVKLVTGALSQREKRPECEAKNSPSSARVSFMACSVIFIGDLAGVYQLLHFSFLGSRGLVAWCHSPSDGNAIDWEAQN